MSISREIKALYQSLQDGLEKEFPVEKEWVNEALIDNLIRDNLEFRIRLSELVGLIKFINNLPIFVPEVEQKILDGIRVASSARNLNPIITNSFFKTVMEHSKVVQTQFFELLRDKVDDAKQMLDKAIVSLKQDRSQNMKQLNNITSSKESLQVCRELIQTATNGVLEEMVVVSQKLETSRWIAMLRAGLFGAKTFSGQVNLRSFNIDSTAVQDTVRTNNVPR